MQYRKGKPSPWIVQYREERGGISRVKTASFATKELAEEFETKLKKQRQMQKHGLELPDEDLLLIDFSRTWMKKRASNPDLAAPTVLGDARKLRKYWLPDFGTMPIAFITTAQVLKHLDKIQFEMGRSPAYRNRHRALMHKLFEDAFMEGKVTANPVARIPLIKETPVRKIIRVKEDAHFDAYLDRIQEEGRNYWLLALIMGQTGCRIAEAIGLQFRDIDLAVGTVTFRRIEQRDGGSKIVERTKGTGVVIEEEDGHVVPLFPALRSAIDQVRATSPFKRPTDFVAHHPKTGHYIPYDTFKDVHARVVKALVEEYLKRGVEYPRFTPHSIRRYFATAAKRAGFTRAEIRELGGWSSEQVVARYEKKDIQHLIDKAKRIGFGEKTDTSNVVELRK